MEPSPVAAVFGMVLVLGFCLLAFLIYFLPAVVAVQRHKRQLAPIFLINFFLGWTFIGWIAALVWAVAED